jgi:hypothetical protein
MATIETGKYKGKTLAQCPTSYILWASRHEKNFSDDHKWVARDAKKLLEAAAPVVAQVAVAEAPKQTYRIISFGHKKERRDLLSEIEAKRESKFALLGEINEIKARSKRSADLGLKGNLSSNQGFRLMR